MKPKTFKVRLLDAMARGSLSRGDLHHWFGRPRATIRYWLSEESAPDYAPLHDPKGDDAWSRLTLLEWAVKNVAGFPIPVTLSYAARPDNIRQLYDDARKKFSKAHPARKRTQGVLRHPQEPGNRKGADAA